MQTDQHPPLYFILQRWAFTLFGYTEWTARSLAALFGTLCVAGMYFLGKELQGKRLGLISAALLVANQYSIRYSHDARPYTMVWLLAILSYLYLIRTVKYLRNKDAAIYTLLCIALIYTNYFAVLALFSQAVIVLLVGWKVKEGRSRLFRVFCISAAAIAISYTPWYRYLFEQVGLKPSWLKPEQDGFLFFYYYAFFGGERLLIPFLLFCPAAYIYSLYKQNAFKLSSRVNNDQLGFFFIVCSISIPLIVLYAYSMLRTPVLQMRYVIVILPGMFVMVAYGLSAIGRNAIIAACVAIFFAAAVYNVVYRHHFYSYPTEMQYRQAALFMAESDKRHPVLNQVNAWHMRYYMKKVGYSGRSLKGSKARVIDSIVNRMPGYDIDTFWLVTGFLDHPLSTPSQRRLDSFYSKARSKEFKTVSATLYGRK
jgi:uncharacterized membrane protein